MSAKPYTLIPNVSELVQDMQPDSIISRTFLSAEPLKAVFFGFDAGQSLSEHTSNKAAILHILEGEGTITLGGDSHQATAGTWIYMPPNLKHSVQAETPLKMLLLMFSASED